MRRTKLRAIREERNFTQLDVATCLKISPTHYQRKESGEAPIKEYEWEKIAKLFDVTIEEIKEDANEKTIHQYFDNVSGNYIGSNNNYCNIPEYLLDIQNKYVLRLEAEVEQLKVEIERFKGQDS